MTVVPIQLVVQQNRRDQAFLQNLQPLLDLTNAIIVIFFLLVLLGYPRLDLGKQHTYIIRFFGDSSVNLQEEVLVMLDGRLILLEYLEDLEVVNIVKRVVRFFDQLIEDHHILMGFELLTKRLELAVGNRKVVGYFGEEELVGFEGGSNRLVEEQIHLYYFKAMDSRQRKDNAEDNIEAMQSNKLTDSLIYNIIKKIEIKMTMEEKYEQARTPQIKMLPPAFAMGYMGIMMASMLYLRFRNKSKLTLKSIIPHTIIAISINEYERYRNIMNLNPEMTNQFRSYQKNTRSIINEKKSRVSLRQEIQKLKLITFSKLEIMLRYKPLY